MAVGITCPFIPHSRRASSSDECPLSEAPLIPPLAPTTITPLEDWAQRGSAGKLTLPLCGDACQSPLVANHRWGYIKGALSRAMPRGRKPWQSRRHEKMRCNRFRGRDDCPLHIWSFGVSSPKSQGFPTHPPTPEHQERKCWAKPQTSPQSGEYHRLTGR